MQPRALIVDDEAPAREELRFLLDQLGTVQVVGEATTGEEALVLLDSLDYDLVLLDIRMPGISGLELAERLSSAPRPPQIVFTTAYPDHAVEAFDVAAADYLVKPFDGERLRRAVERALAAGEPRAEAVEAEGTGPPSAADGGPVRPRVVEPDPLVRIPVQKDGRTVLVQGEAIICATAARGYSSLMLAEERALVSFTLNELERRLHGHFLRVHRSHLVNLRHVRELVTDVRGQLMLVMNDRRRSRVEVSRRHAKELRRRLGV